MKQKNKVFSAIIKIALWGFLITTLSRLHTLENVVEKQQQYLESSSNTIPFLIESDE